MANTGHSTINKSAIAGPKTRSRSFEGPRDVYGGWILALHGRDQAYSGRWTMTTLTFSNSSASKAARASLLGIAVAIVPRELNVCGRLHLSKRPPKSSPLRFEVVDGMLRKMACCA